MKSKFDLEICRSHSNHLDCLILNLLKSCENHTKNSVINYRHYIRYILSACCSCSQSKLQSCSCFQNVSNLGVSITVKNHIHGLQGFWRMLRRFVSQHIASYRKVGASYTQTQGFMSYDSVTTIMDAPTTILYLSTFFLVWDTKKLYLHHIKNIRLCNHKMCSSTTFMYTATAILYLSTFFLVWGTKNCTYTT